jgi:DNA-binding GntR family transcriptional regulator
MLNQELERSTTPDKIADLLREAVLQGEILPGTPLRETKLSSRLGVSRHSVREAFRLLTQDGLLTHHSFRGVIVSELSEEDAKDIYRVRKWLEPLALEIVPNSEQRNALQKAVSQFEKAVEKENWTEAFMADVELHLSLVNLLGSDRFSSLAKSVLHELRLGHLMFDAFATTGFPVSLKPHRDMIRYLFRGKVEKAKQILLEHLEEAEDMLLDLMRKGEKGEN